MLGRAGVLLIAALSLAVASWIAVGAGGSVTPDRDMPVTVGSVQVPAGQLEAAAVRLARAHPRRLAAARKAVAARAIERIWLQGEATARGLRPAAQLGAPRAEVADALVGRGRVPGAAQLADAFDSFHERWRARTRCLADYREPYEDRCGDGLGAAAGTCRWMGEATVCGLHGRVRRRWLVVPGSRSVRAARAAAARLPRRLAGRLRAAHAAVGGLRARGDALAVRGRCMSSPAPHGYAPPRWPERPPNTGRRCGRKPPSARTSPANAKPAPVTRASRVRRSSWLWTRATASYATAIHSCSCSACRTSWGRRRA
jgi:hypothetical protein